MIRNERAQTSALILTIPIGLNRKWAAILSTNSEPIVQHLFEIMRRKKSLSAHGNPFLTQPWLFARFPVSFWRNKVQEKETISKLGPPHGQSGVKKIQHFCEGFLPYRTQKRAYLRGPSRGFRQLSWIVLLDFSYTRRVILIESNKMYAKAWS